MLKASRAESPVLSPMAAPRENVMTNSFDASGDGRSMRPPEVAPCHRTDWRFLHINPDALRATGAPAAQARDLQPLRLMRSARQARLRHKQYVRDLQPQVNAAQDAAQDAARLLESRTTGESRTTSREARRAAGRTERRGARAPSVAAPSRSPLPQPQICGTTAVGRTPPRSSDDVES